MSQIETVKVTGGPKGTRIINKSDFDPNVHTLADKEKPDGKHQKPRRRGGRASVDAK